MSVMTIYNHGTGGSSSKDAGLGEIVNVFGNEARKSGVEHIDWIVTEGVGGAGSPEKRHVAQRVKVDPKTQLPRRGLMSSAAKPGSARIDDYLSSAGVPWLARKLMPEKQAMGVSGIGADENVLYVLNTIKYLDSINRRPDIINMLGWSRGGVTCIRIAHFLNLEPRLNGIPINIFAVDPVAGAGHDTEIEARTVGDNVKNYVATLSVHENRKGFTPMTLTQNAETTLQFKGKTTHAILNMPGLHSETAKFGSSSGRLTFNLCCQFLSIHGSTISPELRGITKMHPDTQLSEYDRMMQGPSAAGVKTGHTGFVAKFITGRERREVFQQTQMDRQGFFINAHHHALFAHKYPVVYRKYFSSLAAIKDTQRWQALDRQAMWQEISMMGPGHLAAIERQHGFTGAPILPQQEAKYLACVVQNKLEG